MSLLLRRAVDGGLGPERVFGRRWEDFDPATLRRIYRLHGAPVEGLAHHTGDMQQALPLMLYDLIARHRFAGDEADLGPAGALIDLHRV